jgi:hypothetical protein
VPVVVCMTGSVCPLSVAVCWAKADDEHWWSGSAAAHFVHQDFRSRTGPAQDELGGSMQQNHD